MSENSKRSSKGEKNQNFNFLLRSVNSAGSNSLISLENCQKIELDVKEIAAILAQVDSIWCCPRSHGFVVRAVACEARRHGFNSSSDQMFFLAWIIAGWNKMDPDLINCVILHIQVDKNK